MPAYGQVQQCQIHFANQYHLQLFKYLDAEFQLHQFLPHGHSVVNLLGLFYLQLGVNPLQSHPPRLHQSHMVCQLLGHHQYLLEFGMGAWYWFLLSFILNPYPRSAWLEMIKMNNLS